MYLSAKGPLGTIYYSNLHGVEGEDDGHFFASGSSLEATLELIHSNDAGH
jgi:hypothetical protein